MGGRPSRTWVIYVVLLLALLVGVVAAVLVGGTPGPAGAGGQHSGQLIVTLPVQVWGLIFLAPLLVAWTVLVLRRLLGGSMSWAARGLVVAVALFAVAILFVYVLGAVGGGGGGTLSVTGPTSPGTNNTSSTSGGGGTNATGTGTPYHGPSLNLPAWAVYVFVAVLCGLVALVAVPGVVSSLVDRRPKHLGLAGSNDAAREELQRALAEASRALDSGADPRTTIVRLYQRLLRDLVPKVAGLEQLTAEEIRTFTLAQLRVRPDAAEALTRLFEEARYSTHPMGPAAAERCRDALRAVEADLARSAVPAAA